MYYAVRKTNRRRGLGDIDPSITGEFRRTPQSLPTGNSGATFVDPSLLASIRANAQQAAAAGGISLPGLKMPAPSGGSMTNLNQWLGEDVIQGSGISKGLAVAGAGLITILAVISKRGSRRR
jgi:hypothetical protein